MSAAPTENHSNVFAGEMMEQLGSLIRRYIMGGVIELYLRRSPVPLSARTKAERAMLDYVAPNMRDNW